MLEWCRAIIKSCRADFSSNRNSSRWSWPNIFRLSQNYFWWSVRSPSSLHINCGIFSFMLPKQYWKLIGKHIRGTDSRSNSILLKHFIESILVTSSKVPIWWLGKSVELKLPKVTLKQIILIIRISPLTLWNSMMFWSHFKKFDPCSFIVWKVLQLGIDAFLLNERSEKVKSVFIHSLKNPPITSPKRTIIQRQIWSALLFSFAAWLNIKEIFHQKFLKNKQFLQSQPNWLKVAAEGVGSLRFSAKGTWEGGGGLYFCFVKFLINTPLKSFPKHLYIYKPKSSSWKAVILG